MMRRLLLLGPGTNGALPIGSLGAAPLPGGTLTFERTGENKNEDDIIMHSHLGGVFPFAKRLRTLRRTAAPSFLWPSAPLTSSPPCRSVSNSCITDVKK